MSVRHLALALAVAFTGFLAAAQAAGPPTPRSPEELVLVAAGLKPTNEALLDFFRQRSRPAPSRVVLERLARTLASRSSSEADEAQRELLGRGVCAVPVLRRVANQVDDVPTAMRARAILQSVQGPRAADLVLAAIKVLAERKPPGATGVMLTYLPFAENDSVFSELEAALPAVAVRGGKVDHALLANLKDDRAVRRGTAGQVLCQVGAGMRKAVRPLLKDSDRGVRLKVALALDEGESIPVLIDLLAEVDFPGRERVDQYLAELAGPWAVSGPAGDEPVARELRRDVWALWWKSLTGKKLLGALESRTLSDDEIDQAQALIDELEKPRSREAAERKLIALGRRVVGLLKRGNRSGADSPAARCLERIKGGGSPALPEPLLRLLRLRRPPGASKALLDYLPCAEDDEIAGRIVALLIELQSDNDKADEIFAKALQSKFAARRWAAAAVLCSKGRPEDLEQVRKLLKDPEGVVRLRAALALASARDPGSIPVLIELVGQLPAEQALAAEEPLDRLAGNDRPEGLDGVADGKKRSAAWARWYRSHKEATLTLGLARSATRPTFRGLTLLVQSQNSTVQELGRDGRVRWSITGLSNPVDAEVLPGNRVLIAEQDKVSERGTSGSVLWSVRVNQPRCVQRLRNGNTFIACFDRLLEVNRSGKTVLEIPLRIGVSAARKLANGRITVFSGGNEVVQLDKSGREMKRASVNCGGAGSNEVLDNGHVLALSPGNGNLIEFDPDGKEVARFDVSGAAHAYRLPNGHTLLTVSGTRYLELDKKWQKVKETNLASPAFRVKQR